MAKHSQSKDVKREVKKDLKNEEKKEKTYCFIDIIDFNYSFRNFYWCKNP